MPIIGKGLTIGVGIVSLLLLFRCSVTSSSIEVTNEEQVIVLAGHTIDEKDQGVPNVTVVLKRLRLRDTTDYGGAFRINATDPMVKAMGIDLKKFVDTLEFYKNGILKSSREIQSQWIDSAIVVRINQITFVGRLTHYDTTIAKIDAVVGTKNGPETGLQVISCAFIKPDFVSGVMFAPTGTIDTHFVFIDIFNKKNVHTGRSDTVFFTTQTGYVPVPVFDPYNTRPVLTMAGTKTVSVNDSVFLDCLVSGRLGKRIVRYEWSVAGNPFEPTPAPRYQGQAPGNVTGGCDTFSCILRVTDDAGLVNQDTTDVVVLQDAPIVNAGADTTVGMGSLVTLRGTARQFFGSIVRWEWKLGTGEFTTVSSCDTTVLAPDYYCNRVACIVRATDDDGNVGTDTVLVTVGRWGELISSSIAASVQDIAVLRGNPCVAYTTVSSRSIINRYNYAINAWDDISPVGIAPEKLRWTSLTASASNLYGLCFDLYNDTVASNRLKLCSYDGFGWQILDSVAYLMDSKEAALCRTELAVIGDYLVVACSTPLGGGKSAILYYTQGTLHPVPAAIRLDSTFSLAVPDSGEALYIAYTDSSKQGRVSVQKYAAAGWQYVGEPGFAACYPKSLSLCANRYGNVSVAYYTPERILSVKRYDGVSWKENATINAEACQNTPYTTASYYNGGKELIVGFNSTVLRHDGNGWVEQPMVDFLKPKQVDYALVAIDAGRVYFAFTDCFTKNKASVYRLW